MSSIGVYRKTFGAEIVDASFDYESCTIGPFTLPIKILHSTEFTNDSAVPRYRLYEELLRDKLALAAFNTNNAVISILTPTQVYQVPIDREHPAAIDLARWVFPPMQITNFGIIGYKKTYPKCLAVNEPPATLLMELGKNIPDGFTEPLPGNPKYYPPFSIYKAMLEADADAVWMDKDTGEVKFIFK